VIQPFLLAPPGVIWIPVKDGNDTARALFDQHYSRYRYADGRRPVLFVGPGTKVVLLTPCARALFVWRKFRSADLTQTGINCAVFRNDGAGRASDLIRAADEFAWERWPGERLYTYVNDRMVKRSRTPGRCFLKAGWRYVRGEDGKPARTKERNLLILERLPGWE
jgi:hypothetical protein